MARGSVAVVALLSVASFAAAQSAGSNARPRASDLGLKIGILPAGHFNAITDVPGVNDNEREWTHNRGTANR